MGNKRLDHFLDAVKKLSKDVLINKSAASTFYCCSCLQLVLCPLIDDTLAFDAAAGAV